MKYNTIAELKAGFEAGEIADDAVLMLDNDYCSVYDSVLCEEVYEGPGYEIREELLDLLGIPWEHV